MSIGILGKKVAMTTALKKYNAIPVTILDITDSVIAGKRMVNEKYAILIGFGKKKHPTKAEQGVFKELGFVPQEIKQIYVDEETYNNVKVGDNLYKLVSALIKSLKGDDQGSKGNNGLVKVDVTGISKGKGFAGVIKRWGFSRQPKTHGQSDRERHPGAIGAQTPGRVLKGKKMAGRMGNKKVTVKNLEVIDLINEDERNYLVLKGAVPGSYGSVVIVKFKS